MACTGWDWDTVVWETDLPRLQALNRYWADNPPLHKMVAAYLGVEPASKHIPADGDEVSAYGESIEEAAEFMPVASLGKEEFDGLLEQFGLPIGK